MTITRILRSFSYRRISKEKQSAYEVGRCLADALSEEGRMRDARRDQQRRKEG